MNNISKLSLELNTLTVFRGLLHDPVVKSLDSLLLVIEKSKSQKRITQYYSEFVSKLFRNTACLTNYITELVMNDENFYIKGKGADKRFDPVIEQAIKNDLQILNKLACIKCDDVLESISFHNGFARWTTRNVNLLEIYCEKIQNLHLTGYGIFSKYYAFIFGDKGLVPVTYPDKQSLEELRAYSRERELIIQNTRSFMAGRHANNALLYGDAGTGKSSTIKAILNHYKNRGLRLIEIKKEQIINLPSLLEKLSSNPLKFILFIDDLSFTKNDDSFSTLKAVLEGSVAATGSNCIIYATSNRRHLIKENMQDRLGDDMHQSDTMQETLSLSARFGLTITFYKPNKDDYLNIVAYYASKHDFNIPQKELFSKAEAFAIRNGGRSPRTAKHFIQFELMSSHDILD